MAVVVEWDQLQEEKATKEQRHSLYRLGYSRWYAHKLTKAQADKAIKDGLARMAALKEGQALEMSNQ